MRTTGENRVIGKDGNIFWDQDLIALGPRPKQYDIQDRRAKAESVYFEPRKVVFEQKRPKAE